MDFHFRLIEPSTTIRVGTTLLVTTTQINFFLPRIFFCNYDEILINIDQQNHNHYVGSKSENFTR